MGYLRATQQSGLSWSNSWSIDRVITVTLKLQKNPWRIGKTTHNDVSVEGWNIWDFWIIFEFPKDALFYHHTHPSQSSLPPPPPAPPAPAPSSSSSSSPSSSSSVSSSVSVSLPPKATSTWLHHRHHRQRHHQDQQQLHSRTNKTLGSWNAHPTSQWKWFTMANLRYQEKNTL